MCDAADLFRIFGDPLTNRFNPAGPYKNMAVAERKLARWIAQWEHDGYGQWVIYLKSDPARVIGFGGVANGQFGDEEKPNLGFRFATEAWGKGLATELAMFSLLTAFSTLNLPEVWGSVRENHLASRHVFEKIGMQEVEVVADPDGAPASVIYRILQQAMS